jgi:hypothetical protein
MSPLAITSHARSTWNRAPVPRTGKRLERASRRRHGQKWSEKWEKGDDIRLDRSQRAFLISCTPPPSLLRSIREISLDTQHAISSRRRIDQRSAVRSQWLRVLGFARREAARGTFAVYGSKRAVSDRIPHLLRAEFLLPLFPRSHGVPAVASLDFSPRAALGRLALGILLVACVIVPPVAPVARVTRSKVMARAACPAADLVELRRLQCLMDCSRRCSKASRRKLK